MTTLVAFREKLKNIYAKAGVYINHGLVFVLAFLTNLIVGSKLGNGGLISSPLICLALALVCAFFPVNVTVIITTVYIIIHLFSLSLELALIAVAVIFVVYLLYFRFAPKTGVIIILTPLLFFIKMPYIIPVVVALTSGLAGIVPTVCGVFIYYLVDFASNYKTAITTLSADTALQNINFIFNNILTNKELIVVIVSFALVITMIYSIKRLSVNYSWMIAIIAGSVTDALIQIIAFSVLRVDYSILFMILGHIVAILIGIAVSFFIFSVDYSATEYVQFEDDDYYYYVKAIPKITVSEKKVTVKKINERQQNRGFVHTESLYNDNNPIDE